jgi:hypothetical protein
MIEIGDKVIIKKEYRETVNPLMGNFSKVNDKIWNAYRVIERTKDVEIKRGHYKMEIWNEFDIGCEGIFVTGVNESFLESVIENREKLINEIISQQTKMTFGV